MIRKPSIKILVLAAMAGASLVGASLLRSGTRTLQGTYGCKPAVTKGCVNYACPTFCEAESAPDPGIIFTCVCAPGHPDRTTAK